MDGETRNGSSTLSCVMPSNNALKSQERLPPQSEKKERPFNEPRSSEEPRDSHFAAPRSAAGVAAPCIHCKSHGPAGRTFSGALIAKCNPTGCCRSPGGVAFFILFAIFPAITALVSAYGSSSTPPPSARTCRCCRTSYPATCSAFSTSKPCASPATQRRAQFGVVIGIVVSLWSAMGGIKA